MLFASCDQNHNQAFHVKVLSDRLPILSKRILPTLHDLFSATSKTTGFSTHVGIYRPSIPSKEKYENHMRRTYCPDGFVSHPGTPRRRYKYLSFFFTLLFSTSTASWLFSKHPAQNGMKFCSFRLSKISRIYSMFSPVAFSLSTVDLHRAWNFESSQNRLNYLNERVEFLFPRN